MTLLHRLPKIPKFDARNHLQQGAFMRRTIGPLTLALALTACYHATIETGRPPSPQTVEKAFAAGWIYGLVPPSTVQTASQCPAGVSRVETQLSFVNQLVSFITLGIFTPMAIKVTCAASGSDDAAGTSGAVQIDPDKSMDRQQREFTEAARRSAAIGQPVWVVFQ